MISLKCRGCVNENQGKHSRLVVWLQLSFEDSSFSDYFDSPGIGS